MQGHYVRGLWRHGGGDRCPVYFIPDVKIFFFHLLRCGKTHALLSSSVEDDHKDFCRMTVFPLSAHNIVYSPIAIVPNSIVCE